MPCDASDFPVTLLRWQQVEVWPPAAPLVYWGNYSSQAAVPASDSDGPRNMYLDDGVRAPVGLTSGATPSGQRASTSSAIQHEDSAAHSAALQQREGASASAGFPNQATRTDGDVAASAHGGMRSHPQYSQHAPAELARLQSEQSQDDHREAALQDTSPRESGQQSNNLSKGRPQNVDGPPEGGDGPGSNDAAPRPGSASQRVDRRSNVWDPADLPGNSIGKTNEKVE